MVTAERILGAASQPKAAAAQGESAAQQQGLGSSAHGPLTGYLQQQQQWHQHAKPAELSAKSCLAKSPASLAERYMTEKRPLADMGLRAGADVARKQPAAADRHAHSAGASTPVSRSAPQQDQRSLVSRDSKPQSHMLLARPSTLKSPLCTPGSRSGLSPLQHFTIPKLKTPSAALAGNCTPTLASKQSAAQEWAGKLKPCRGFGGQPAKQQASANGHPSNVPSNVTPCRGHAGAHSAEPQASAKGKPSDAPSSAPVVVDLCTPAAVTIPRLKPATAAQLGQSPLAFPGFSPAAAQTPAFHSNMRADSMGAVTELVPRHAEGMQQQQCCTPLLPSRPAGPAQVIASSAVQTDAERASGFGSPLLIQDTPQVTTRRGADSCPAGAAPEAAAEVDAPSSAASAPPGTAPREASASPDTFARARAEPAQQQPEHQPADSFNSASRQQLGAMVRKAQRRERKRTQSSAEQQENTEAGRVQQAGHADGRVPLIAMAGAALNQAGSSEMSSRGRKRQKGEAGGRASYAQGGDISQQASTGCLAELLLHGPTRSAPRVLGLSSGRNLSSVLCSA